MPEADQNHQNEFMIEKIKERPVNKKKLIRRTIITAAMAVIFGLIACFTFLVLEPVINNWLYPEEEPQIVVFPEDQEEMSPEEMLSNNMQVESTEPDEPESTPLEEEQIQEILSGFTMGKDHYRQLYSALSNFVGELNQSMVTVTGVSSDLDWFNNVQESKDQSSGVIIANNGKELLILADYGPIKEAEKLTLTFHNNTQANAVLKQYDSTTQLAVLGVNLSDLNSQLVEEGIRIAALGSSNIKNMVGMPVIAMGSPMGTRGSVCYGMISAAGGVVSAVDANYKLLVTDIYGSQNAGGFLFNLQGEVIGVIVEGNSDSDIKNILNAYGISELKKLVEKMTNGSPVAYLGIRGVAVTADAHENLSVPYGAFVKDVAMESPAMLAGIQQGDVIVSINNETVMNFNEYTTLLMGLEAGQNIYVTVMRQANEEYKEMNFEITLGEAK